MARVVISEHWFCEWFRDGSKKCFTIYWLAREGNAAPVWPAADLEMTRRVLISLNTENAFNSSDRQIFVHVLLDNINKREAIWLFANFLSPDQCLLSWHPHFV